MLFQVAASLKTVYNCSNNTVLASDLSSMRLFIALFERGHVGVQLQVSNMNFSNWTPTPLLRQ